MPMFQKKLGVLDRIVDVLLAADWSRPVPAAREAEAATEDVEATALPGRSEAEIKAEPAWAVISTDPERPTLALVTFAGNPDGVVSRWWRDRDALRNDNSLWYYADDVTSVTVLHTYNPETHVPVERVPSADSVLVRELRWSLGLTCPDEYTAAALRSALAALADGAES